MADGDGVFCAAGRTEAQAGPTASTSGLRRST
jgi:hypothetical protein